MGVKNTLKLYAGTYLVVENQPPTFAWTPMWKNLKNAYRGPKMTPKSLKIRYKFAKMVEIDVDFHQIVRYMVLDEKQKESPTNKRSMGDQIPWNHPAQFRRAV